MQVQNAVEFLKMIGSLDENENLTDLGMPYILISSKLYRNVGTETYSTL